MRRPVALCVVMLMVSAAFPAGAFGAVNASKQPGATLTGVARGADKAPLPNYTVRVRRVDDGALAGSTTTNQAGEFTFTGLGPGNYVVEIVNAAGKVVGMSPSLAVPAGATLTIGVSASAAGALTAATGSGFSLFGLGQLASVAVIGAAGATAVAAVVATRQDASPSR